MRETDIIIWTATLAQQYYTCNVALQHSGVSGRDSLLTCKLLALSRLLLTQAWAFVTQSHRAAKPLRCFTPGHTNPKYSRPGSIHTLQNGRPHSIQRRFNKAGRLNR